MHLRGLAHRAHHANGSCRAVSKPYKLNVAAVNSSSAATVLTSYDQQGPNFFSSIGSGLRNYTHDANVRQFEELGELVASVQTAAVQEQELPDAWVHQLYAHVVPPAACGDLVLQFVNLLEALHALGSPPPPPAWLESLDEALTSHLTTISEGVCPWRHSTKSSSSRTGPAWPLTTVQCVLLLSLAAKHVREAGGAGGSSSEGAAQPLVFPLLCEAALLKAGQADGDAVLFDDSLPPHTPPEVEEALDEYHEVLRREMGPGRMLPPGLCRVKGPAACELQVPLLRRHRQRHLTAEELVCVTETLLEAEKHSQSEDHARWELQPQLECALQELHRRMQQQLQQDSRTPPHGSSSQEGGHQDQRLSASRAWDVSKRVLWVVLLQHNQHKHLMEPSLAQHALGCARSALALAEAEGGATLADARKWLDGTVPRLLDDLCAEQGHPAILTDGVVLLSRAPRLDPTWRTPGAVVARLDSFLTFFTDAQLVDVLRALGRFTALHEPATDASPSASNAGGGSGMQGTDVAGAVQLPPPVTVPLEVLLPKNAQAFSSSTHADGDLLARIGQRLSRGLLSQPRGRQGQVLARLGLKD